MNLELKLKTTESRNEVLQNQLRITKENEDSLRKSSNLQAKRLHEMKLRESQEKDQIKNLSAEKYFIGAQPL